MVFGLLELSKRAYIDPSHFIKHLGLDAGLQQDAQEFSNLFLSVLEQNLQLDVSPSGNGKNNSNVIKDQFCGKYAYVTRCSNCSNASERLSNFYELDLNIQGHKTLTESLKLFLHEEKLDGDNQYMCCNCNAKQDATRAIELKSLPPVLNLQLLRFVFDLKTGSKKKLNSCIQFPDVLDMRPYLPNDKSAVYDLSAVLIHRGASAYSGHYVAHIKGKDSQAWYKFNDEEVEKIKGRNLQLGSEEDLESKKQKTTRTPKGHHASKNAYMLVYTKQKGLKGENEAEKIVEDKVAENDVRESVSAPCVSEEAKDDNGEACKSSNGNCLVSKSEGELGDGDESGKSAETGKSSETGKGVETGKGGIKEVELADGTETKEAFQTMQSATRLLPTNVLRYIEKDNDKFENWILEMNSMMEESITKGQEKQETVKAIYQDLTYVKEDEDKYEWLPLSWFSKWLNDPATAPAIDVSGLICSHGKVCPERCLKMKCVSQRGSDQLFSMYGGEVRLKGDNSLCEKCVKHKCNIIRTKKRIAEDDKYMASIMKTSFFEGPCFWIGKGSFRSWRRLAVESLEEGDQVPSDKNDVNSDDDIDDSGEGDSNGNNSNKSDLDECVTQSTLNGTVELHGVDKKEEQDSEKSGKSSEANEDSLDFNEDLLCEKHGGLDPDMNCRRLVPESVWVRLKRYFPNCAEFNAESASCEKCSASIERENESKFVNKQLAYDQKNCLLDLFHDRKRPILLNPGIIVYAVSTEFLEIWRRFVRDPSKYNRIMNCVNSILLCEHGGYLYPPENENLKSDSRVTYVSPVEWKIVQTHFETDCAIVLKCVLENDKRVTNIEPKVCDICLQVRLSFEEHEMYDYDKGLLYVRKLTKLENKPNTNPISENQDSNLDDPEFTGSSGAASSGKKRSSMSGPDLNLEPAEKFLKVKAGDKIVRKSQRHRRARGEKEVAISSKSTLKDLKLEIMSLFAVPPFDQNLYIDGKLLEGNGSTLTELRVPSGAVIELVADEPQEDMCFLEDITKESGIPESGFKGTNLLSAQ